MLFESLNADDLPAAIVADDNGTYRFTRSVSESEIVETAKTLLGRRVLQTTFIENTQVARDFFITQLSALDCEVFCVAFLNQKYRVITCEQMFRGTFNTAPIYPREVVRQALSLNAAAVMFAHNHPSGDATPSQSDQQITQELVEALYLFDIKVLDHFVIAGDRVTSFAEQGLINQITKKVKCCRHR